jgi:hypothetical protein
VAAQVHDPHGDLHPPPDAAIARLAARQHGVVTRAQLLAAGVGRGAIEQRLRRRILHRLHHGVYAVVHPSVSSEGRDLAAVLACGPRAALSHQSAAALWELRPPWRGPVHVTAGRAGARPGIVVHRSRDLSTADVARHRGIPVTTPARTLRDLAGILPEAALRRAVNEAQVRRLVRADELEQRPPGRRALVVSSADGATRSALEDRFLAFLAGHGLPPPQVNARVEGLEVDFFWPRHGLVVELDGFAFHHTRLAFETDRRRDAALQAAGLRVVRVTDRRLTGDAAGLAAQLERLTGDAAGLAAQLERLTRDGDQAGAGSRSGLTSAGAPRSGNGTSIASKSRGTTVSGNTVRASSRTSRGK